LPLRAARPLDPGMRSALCRTRGRLRPGLRARPLLRHDLVGAVSIWKRVRAALTPKPPNLDDRVRLSFDAAAALSAPDLVAALWESAELASFVRAVGVE